MTDANPKSYRFSHRSPAAFRLRGVERQVFTVGHLHIGHPEQTTDTPSRSAQSHFRLIHLWGTVRPSPAARLSGIYLSRIRPSAFELITAGFYRVLFRDMEIGELNAEELHFRAERRVV